MKTIDKLYFYGQFKPTIYFNPSHTPALALHTKCEAHLQLAPRASTSTRLNQGAKSAPQGHVVARCAPDSTSQVWQTCQTPARAWRDDAMLLRAFASAPVCRDAAGAPAGK
jgi:hypothetical protein